jgi:hypothetical protein
LQDDDDITNYDETTSKSDKFTHAIVDAPVPVKPQTVVADVHNYDLEFPKLNTFDQTKVSFIIIINLSF